MADPEEKEASEPSTSESAVVEETEKKATISPFELTPETVSSLEDGEVPGLPIEFGAAEKTVLDVLGEPKERKEDENNGHVELIYEHATVDLTYYPNGPEKVDEPVVNSVIYKINVKKSEIQEVLGTPTNERAVAPNYPELEYLPGPFLLLFLTETEREFEGPYDKVLIIKQ